MKKYVILYLILSVTVLLANVRNVKADVFLLGDSWLAGTYNPVADEIIGYHTNLTVHNYAIDSMSSGYLDAHMPMYPVKAGDVAIIDIGLPDFFNGVPKATIIANMRRVVDTLAHRDVKIILSCPADGVNKQDLNTKIVMGNLTAATDMCNAIKSRNTRAVRVVDLQSKLMAISSFNVVPGDPVHLNEDGYHVFNMGVALAANRMVGECKLLDLQELRDWFDKYPAMTQEQRCTAGQIMENYWLNL